MRVRHQNIAVSESLSDWGETLCAACPNPTTVITAGTSTVVCVWDVLVNKDKLSHMKLRQVSVFACDSTRQSVFTYILTLLLVSTAFIWSHRRSDMPGCVRGPQFDCERLS